MCNHCLSATTPVPLVLSERWMSLYFHNNPNIAFGDRKEYIGTIVPNIYVGKNGHGHNNKRLCLSLFDDYGPVCKITTNIPEEKDCGMAGTIAIKSYDDGPGLLDALMQAGYIEWTGIDIPLEHGNALCTYTLTPKFLKEQPQVTKFLYENDMLETFEDAFIRYS